MFRLPKHSHMFEFLFFVSVKRCRLSGKQTNENGNCSFLLRQAEEEEKKQFQFECINNEQRNENVEVKKHVM